MRMLYSVCHPELENAVSTRLKLVSRLLPKKALQSCALDFCFSWCFCHQVSFSGVTLTPSSSLPVGLMPLLKPLFNGAFTLTLFLIFVFSSFIFCVLYLFQLANSPLWITCLTCHLSCFFFFKDFLSIF